MQGAAAGFVGMELVQNAAPEADLVGGAPEALGRAVGTGCPGRVIVLIELAAAGEDVVDKGEARDAGRADLGTETGRAGGGTDKAGGSGPHPRVVARRADAGATAQREGGRAVGADR